MCQSVTCELQRPAFRTPCRRAAVPPWIHDAVRRSESASELARPDTEQATDCTHSLARLRRALRRSVRP